MSTEKNKEPLDLLEQLSKQTDFKQPSENTNNGWDFENDEKEKQPISPNIPNIPNIPKPDAIETEKVNGKKLSAADIKIGAEASQAVVEFLTSIMAEGIINIKYYRKFTAEQRELLSDELLDRDIETLSDENKILVNRWHRLMKAKAGKLKNVATSVAQRERMVNAFEKYSELTGKTFVTPGLMIGVGIGESIIKTAIEAFLD